MNTVTTHEAKPTRTALERVVCRLSIKTPEMGDKGGSGTPEFTTSDIAAAAEGFNDPIGRHILGVLLDDAQSVDQCLEQLDRTGWSWWHRDGRKAKVDTDLHYRMAEAALAEIQHGKGWPMESLREHFGVGRDRLHQLLPHYLTLTRALNAQIGDLSAHLRKKLSDSD